MSRVLAVGDLHGIMTALQSAIAVAVDVEADAIVQVGDFWLADRHWSKFTARHSAYMETAAASPVPIVAIDGNHEIWPTLARFAATPEALQAAAARRPVSLGGSLWWAQRGSVWTWNGCRVGALGGAVSPDKHIEDVRRYRWPEETVTDADLGRLVENADVEHDGKLDLLFTHDAPAQTRGLRGGVDYLWRFPEVEAEMNQTRKLLAEAVVRLEPGTLLHGHWHQHNRETINETTDAVSLAANMEPGTAAAAVLDLHGPGVDVETTGIGYRTDTARWAASARDITRLAEL